MPCYIRKPVGKSGPLVTRNPKIKSASNCFRNPVNTSGSLIARKPVDESESQNVSRPKKESGSFVGRNPQCRSGPSKASNPRYESEPSKARKPIEPSESSDIRNPDIDSGSLTLSNPKIDSDGWKPRIRALIEMYYDTQLLRIAANNRLKAVLRDEYARAHDGQKPTLEESARLLKQFKELSGIRPEIQKELEKQIKDYIMPQIKGLPIVVWLRGVKGIGPCLAGGLISWLDPRGSTKHPADHASSFWRYMGLTPTSFRKKGEKTDYNPKAKVLAWKIAESFVKHRTPLYRDIYDQAKPKEAAKLNHPEKDYHNCPLFPDQCRAWQRMTAKQKRTGKEGKKKPPCLRHIDYRAKRPMVKRFITDLWLTWRRLEGLPVSEPYAVAILGHDKQELGKDSNPTQPSEPH